MTGTTICRATGRWREILPRLGVETRFLVNRHGPCPACGGKDRFRFDDKDGSGSYYCHQCGAGGSGILLLRKLHGWTHKEACDAVDGIIGLDAKPEHETQQDQSDPEREREKRQRLIERTLRDAQAPEVVADYLQRRGLGVVADSLQGHPALWHSDAQHSLPAVLAPIFGPSGDLQSVQRIYVGDVTPRKMTLPPIDTIKGGAVRLFPAADVLGISEGVETGLACHQLWGIPVWATISEGGMTSFEPPAGLRRALVFGDNDSNFVGQAAAHTLAKRLHRDGIAVEVHIPEDADTDWLDVLSEGAR
jgi:putative DNA primase/helicase